MLLTSIQVSRDIWRIYFLFEILYGYELYHLHDGVNKFNRRLSRRDSAELFEVITMLLMSLGTILESKAGEEKVKSVNRCKKAKPIGFVENGRCSITGMRCCRKARIASEMSLVS